MYTLLPFQFARFQDDVLLVNECGDFIFITSEDFDLLIRDLLPREHPSFYNLKSKLFLAEDKQIAIRKTTAKYRSRKAFLRDFTSLHMMVITLRCNQKCEYCQVSCADDDAHVYDMSKETAEKIIDCIFQSPSNNIKIEFQGGEPLLNWATLEHSVLYAKQNAPADKALSFVLCTNLIAITEEQLRFCKEHSVSISTSLDGPEALHDACRKPRIGTGTYQFFKEKLALSRAICGHESVNALMTTSSKSIDNLQSVVDEYIDSRLDGIFIRSLNPYGFAAEHEQELSYGMNRFVEKYLEVLRYIIKKNEELYFPEYFATLLFSRILTPFSTGFVDLQSPAGAGIGGVIYDFDGSVFPTDEARMLARMGDRHFCLGNVKTDFFHDIFAGAQLQNLTAGSCIEATPHCASCVYQAYCGTDPVRNYLECGHEVRNMAQTPFCVKHKGILDGLFAFWKDSSEREKAIIWSWITRNPDIARVGS